MIDESEENQEMQPVESTKNNHGVKVLSNVKLTSSSSEMFSPSIIQQYNNQTDRGNEEEAAEVIMMFSPRPRMKCRSFNAPKH